jgi:hypothetical protein
MAPFTVVASADKRAEICPLLFSSLSNQLTSFVNIPGTANTEQGTHETPLIGVIHNSTLTLGQRKTDRAAIDRSNLRANIISRTRFTRFSPMTPKKKCWLK